MRMQHDRKQCNDFENGRMDIHDGGGGGGGGQASTSRTDVNVA